MVRSIVAIAFGLGLFGSDPTTAMGDSDTADALFREGRQLLATGRFDEACTKFRESNQAEASVGALLNLAECELKRDDPAAAWTAFRRAELLARATKDGGRERFARRQQGKLAQKLGFIRVTVPLRWQSAPNLVVEVNDQPLPATLIDQPVPLEPGVHRVSATADGAEPFAVDLDVAIAPEPVAVEIALEPTETPGGGERGGAGQPRDPVRRDPRRLVGISMSAVGAAAVVVSVALGAAARSQWKGVKDCRDMPPCTPEQIETGDSANTKANLATGFFVVGALLAGGGIALWLTATDDDRVDDKVGPETRPPGVSLAPVIDGQTIGVAASGSF